MNLESHRPPPEIPTSSMADIAFLLIIFFMVTTVFAASQGLTLTLPTIETGDPDPDPATVIQVTAGGVLVDCDLVDLDAIGATVDPRRTVVLYSHPEVHYARMVEVYDRLSTAGIGDLQVPTRSDIEDYRTRFGVNPLVEACR